MNNMNQDYELEKRNAPENFQDDTWKEEADDLIDIVQDALDELDRFSVRHDDIFNYQVDEINNALKGCRIQLQGQETDYDTNKPEEAGSEASDFMNEQATLIK